ncbi:MAG TPA: phosphoribosyl-AMP cyclohydrolase, partial [Alcanivorax sp.]|nr:phosphoribosyl-AMP cyclohydrolase [Alcanivorax sp.]
MFKDNEQQPEGFSVPLSEALDNLAFNDAGLVPVIAQQHDTGEVLMFAWMNRAAIE